MFVKFRRYQIEMRAVTMRLGRWQEAEDKFNGSAEHAFKECKNAAFDGGFDG